MSVNYEEEILKRRNLLKASNWRIEKEGDWWKSHQQKGIPAPPIVKPVPENAMLIDLVQPEELTIKDIPLFDAVSSRKSHRAFTDEKISLEELSFLLWTTQGVHEVDKKKIWTKRVVPSGGARHPFETYLLINRVEGIKEGVYRYHPIENKLILINSQIDQETVKKAWYQDFIGKSAVIFIWTAIPYRTEWRYSLISYKDILIEAGHICQNLYLACEAINAGTCAIAAYEQKVVDSLIQVDGKEELAVYLAPVGKI
ncbi:MAG: SagB/ThcOx family dehydrogenase [Candidatus Lokiarchaeota archaeon]|nr:SagB/ThcOx family dehydrogenase [Candidatus Lokiarchaeota archaeon]